MQQRRDLSARRRLRPRRRLRRETSRARQWRRLPTWRRLRLIWVECADRSLASLGGTCRAVYSRDGALSVQHLLPGHVSRFREPVRLDEVHQLGRELLLLPAIGHWDRVATKDEMELRLGEGRSKRLSRVHIKPGEAAVQLGLELAGLADVSSSPARAENHLRVVARGAVLTYGDEPQVVSAAAAATAAVDTAGSAEPVDATATPRRATGTTLAAARIAWAGWHVWIPPAVMRQRTSCPMLACVSVRLAWAGMRWPPENKLPRRAGIDSILTGAVRR
eukprot:scaffold30090_cov112-Isochrysis_galbana.AAC.4